MTSFLANAQDGFAQKETPRSRASWRYRRRATLLARRGAAAEFVEEVQQERQAGERLVCARIVADHRRRRLPSGSQIVIRIGDKIPQASLLSHPRLPRSERIADAVQITAIGA